MILLDTHALIWWVMDPKRLSREAGRSIQRAAKSGSLAIAAITQWELAVLLARGHIRGQGTVRSDVERLISAPGVLVLELTPEIAATAAQLPDSVLKDPADRLIVATALVHAIPLITKNDRIHASKTCRAVW